MSAIAADIAFMSAIPLSAEETVSLASALVRSECSAFCWVMLDISTSDALVSSMLEAWTLAPSASGCVEAETCAAPSAVRALMLAKSDVILVRWRRAFRCNTHPTMPMKARTERNPPDQNKSWARTEACWLSRSL